jgi:hypothetical protein
MRASANSAPPILAALSASFSRSLVAGSIAGSSDRAERVASDSALASAGVASAAAPATALVFRKSRLEVI